MSNDETFTTGEPAGIPERMDDRPQEHAAGAGEDGSMNRTTGAGADTDEPAMAGMDAPGVPDSAQAASGPTQATTSGTGPAAAAGQDVPTTGQALPDVGPGPTDSVGAASAASDEPGAGTGASAPEPGANGAMESGADPVTELADDLGLAPGATDVADAGQDNGLNS